MSVRAGQLIHSGGGFLMDRLQTAGAGNLNIPEEKIAELGNYKTVGIQRDTPDLTFDLESFDMTTELEAILANIDPTTVVDNDAIDLDTAKPIDIIGPVKDQGGAFTTVRGVALPHLTLETASYRFGLNQSASESYTLRGDSIFYVPGTPYYAEYTVSLGTEVGPYVLTNAALAYESSGVTRYVLSATLIKASGTIQRLFHGLDWTDTANDFTLTANAGAVAGDTVRVLYGSAVPATFAQAVHPTTTTKPAGVRGRDIDVYVGPQGGTLIRWAGVQGFEGTYRRQLDRDMEFGNDYAVAQDYDNPEASGNITMRPATIQYLFDRIAQVTDTPSNQVADALSSIPLEIEVRVSHPDTGARIKTLFVPDARIQPPGVQGRVNQKLENTFPWSSESGTLTVYMGERVAA